MTSVVNQLKANATLNTSNVMTNKGGIEQLWVEIGGPNEGRGKSMVWTDRQAAGPPVKKAPSSTGGSMGSTTSKATAGGAGEGQSAAAGLQLRPGFAYSLCYLSAL